MCVDCKSDYQKNHGRATSDIRNQSRWKHQGIKNPDGSQFSTDDYSRMLEAQNHKCSLCGVDDKFHRLNVDHNHKTMIVRLLLCDHCNRNIVGKYEKTGYCKKKMEAEAYLIRSQGYIPKFPTVTAGALYRRTYYMNEENYHRDRERHWRSNGVNFNGRPLIWDIAELIMKETNNCCAICGKPSTFENLSADHDKSTGEVRGFLCYECNQRGVGNVEKYGSYRNDKLTGLIKDYLMDPPSNRLKDGRENDPEFAPAT